jgi:hypothetical protein
MPPPAYVLLHAHARLGGADRDRCLTINKHRLIYSP